MRLDFESLLLTSPVTSSAPTTPVALNTVQSGTCYTDTLNMVHFQQNPLHMVSHIFTLNNFVNINVAICNQITNHMVNINITVNLLNQVASSGDTFGPMCGLETGSQHIYIDIGNDPGDSLTLK